MIIHYKFYSIHICTVWINYKTNTYVPVPITQLQKQIISEWQNPSCSPPQSHLLPLPGVTSVIFHALLFCMVLQHITASIYCIILHVVQLYINIFFHEKKSFANCYDNLSVSYYQQISSIFPLCNDIPLKNHTFHCPTVSSSSFTTTHCFVCDSCAKIFFHNIACQHSSPGLLQKNKS